MKVLLVHTHPNPASFGHALYEQARQTLRAEGHELRCRDLYAKPMKLALDAADFEYFADGRLPDDIRGEQALIDWAELLVFVYPVWWYERPARLKGWFDRVWTHGFAYRYDAQGPHGLLAGKRALVFQTTGASEADYAAEQALDAIVRPMRDGTLRFCGVEVLTYRTFYAVPHVGPEQRAVMLDELRTTLEGLSSSAPHSKA